MIRLSLRALIALCAAMAVYVSVLSWRGARAKEKYKAEDLVELTKAIKKPTSLEENSTPAIGELPETEISANTTYFQESLQAWIRENAQGTLAWALSLESNERKSLVFSELLPMWMLSSPQECGEWLISNQDQAFIEEGLLRAVVDRGELSPYHGIKLALNLKQRDWRSYTLEGIYLIWAQSRPEQAVSYLDDLKVLPEYENLLLLTLNTWAQNDFAKAYKWMVNSKNPDKEKLIRFVFLLNCATNAVSYLDWIFISLEPEKREAYLKDFIERAFPKNEKVILKKVLSLSSYKKDLCYGWIAVTSVGKKTKPKENYLSKIRSKKELKKFKNLVNSKLAKENPSRLMADLSVLELRELGEIRSSLLRGFADKNPQKAFDWLISETPKSLLRELIFYSQDDLVSGMTKNLQLSSYFVENFPAEVNKKPLIDDLLNSSFINAKEIYDDYLASVKHMLSSVIKYQLSKKQIKSSRDKITGSKLRDLYTTQLLIHPNYTFSPESLALFRSIEDKDMSNLVVNFLAWEVKEENIPRFLDFAESNDFLNYSLVSVVLKRWAQFDQKKASAWLNEHSSATWYIAACANYSAQLINLSISDFQKFAQGIQVSKRNHYINKLTIVFSETSPELLAVLPGAINIKKYLQTSKKEK
ncbi:hypothetical protein PQO01_20860 [Lentisphaera marina]|uniref:hypothetical protein n=1 Tax=Lentisphaera marina TaxID=1111041 RepID=UPI002366502E|nr:hypothetical protein [Lentisphaera marina]MDD7987410.1 hypothetical protein [Lentisphaera marina]